MDFFFSSVEDPTQIRMQTDEWRMSAYGENRINSLPRAILLRRYANRATN